MRILTLLLLVACAPRVRVFGESPPADAARYSVLLAGAPKGSFVSWTAADKARLSRFEYNDRGRGPEIVERAVVDAAGLPVEVRCLGHDYYKAPVDERFDRQGAAARWKNGAEDGSSEQPGFYLSMYGTPDDSALLVRALLAVPGHKLPILPAGEARLVRVREVEVSPPRKVVLHAVHGLDLTPMYFWLDEDGSYFAAGDTWFAIVRRGWEGAMPKLIDEVRAERDVRRDELARKLARRPSAVVIRGARVLDVEKGQARPATVLIEGNRISSVGGEPKVPEGAEVIEAAGKTLLPGFWDMHVHSDDDAGPVHLAAGVTTARDLANDMDETLRRKQRVDQGALLGPRLILAGFIDGPGPYAGPTKVLAATEAEGRAAVARYAEKGYVQIKLYSSLKPELVAPIVDEAHKRGLRVSGHVPAFMTVEQAVRAGYDEIQHANFLFLNFWPDVGDTRTPARFTAVAERAAGLDLGSEQVRSFIALLRERRTVVDPTLNAFESLFVARRGSVDPTMAAAAHRLPPQVRRTLLTGGLPVPEGKDGLYRQSFAAMLKMVKLLHDAGVPLVAGTDAFPGFTFHRELEIYAEAGIPPADVLRIATLGAARVMGRDGEVGSIAPGKLADLVLVDGDPLARISDVRRVATVVKGGAVYDSEQLYEAAGVLQR